MRISDWSSDVCSSDLHALDHGLAALGVGRHAERGILLRQAVEGDAHPLLVGLGLRLDRHLDDRLRELHALQDDRVLRVAQRLAGGGVLQRSEEHTSELQSLMRISYAVFCLKKKKQIYNIQTNNYNRTEHQHCNTQQQ